MATPPPSNPSRGALYGDKLKCTIVSDLSDSPRITFTSEFPPIPSNTRQKQTREMELNSGGLSVFKFGPTRRNVILPSNFWPSWIQSMLEEMDDRNISVSVLGMESGKASAVMPLRWKVGGSPNIGVYTSEVTGAAYIVQYDPSRGVRLIEVGNSSEDDVLPFMPYPPSNMSFSRFPFDRGAFLFSSGSNVAQNSNYLNETLSVPQYWNISPAAPTAETHYGVLENASFLNPDLNVLWLAKPTIDAVNYYWKTDPMTCANPESDTAFVGVQTFDATARVEIKFAPSGTIVSQNITDLYTCEVIDIKSLAPVGTTSAELILLLTSSTGEVWFSASQFQRGKCFNPIIGIEKAAVTAASWVGSELYYDLENAFHPMAEEYAVAFCYVQPGWTTDICAAETVMAFYSVDHGTSNIKVKMVGGASLSGVNLYVDGVLKDTDSITNYEPGDSFLAMLVYKDAEVTSYLVNLRDVDTLFTCTTATLPVSPLTRLFPGNDQGTDQMDGLIGNVVVLTHEDDVGESETLATMRDYLTNEHMIDIARQYLGRKYSVDFQIDPYIRKLIGKGAVVLTETEKY